MNIHTHTPDIGVIDPRGLLICSVGYCRSDEGEIADDRVTRQVFDAAGRAVASRDPRLWDVEGLVANLSTVYSLSAQPLFTDSVDAGWRLALPGEAGQMVEAWDGRGSHRQTACDDLLRPVAICESVGARLARESISQTTSTSIVERFTYGGPDTAEHNQCNQLIRHDDPAGTVRWPHYSLLGSPVSEIRRFLIEPDTPDWPPLEAERNELLEVQELQTRWRFNALGETLERTDAMGNSQQFAQTVAGQLKSVSLGLAGGGQAKPLVRDIHYNAFNQVEQETAGNGVLSRFTYDLQNGRLTEISSGLTGYPPLQQLKYCYDPVGNILQIEDAAQPVQFFANQRIEPVNQYRYDTLYQLIEATGREVKTGSSYGPALPELQGLPPDPNQIANYRQSYDYDAAGNLLQMRHVGAQTFTRSMLVAPDSNRSLPESEVDVDFDTGFDANGNLQQLIRGQDLRWDVRNQLREVTAVKRDDGPDDVERYIYDGGGQRCRKIRGTQSRNRTLIEEVRYLPGLEIRSGADGEILHVICVSAGRNSVRVLHWQVKTPPGIANDQLRYSLNDHLGSSTLELDHQGSLISLESYYPFGGTAWWAARSAVEAKYKTVRYSGKERDATGLYYYGFRYYAPWLQRWINPDPAGEVDGLNMYVMVGNQPISYVDREGLELTDALKLLAERTAVELFRSGEALNPFSKREALIKAGDWMREKIRKMGLSRTKYGRETWTYAETHFFEREQALAVDRFEMTPNQKQGFHLFWAINAGSRYINRATRSVTFETPYQPQDFRAVRNAALAELNRNTGESTVKLSFTRRTTMFDPALDMLEKYHDYPAGVARLFIASLGKLMSGELYRGARVAGVADLKEGAQLTTSGFTSFTPDEKTAKEFMGETFHDEAFVARTSPVLFILQGGAREITSLSEIEGLIEPQRNFEVTSTRREGRHLNVFIKASNKRGIGLWI